MSVKLQTGIEDFEVKFATEEDCQMVLDFILELARYEKLEHEVVATKEVLYDSLFVKKQAQVIVGYYKGKPACFALFFYNFSTFLGKANMYLEDLYVRHEYRKNGFGKAMFKILAQIALQNNCERLDWWCLDWNKNAVDFYLRLGAVAMDEWTVYRVTGENLKKLAH